ncbi:MAG: hypothetical protein ABGW77_05220 [Campylobacterales bacterium]
MAEDIGKLLHSYVRLISDIVTGSLAFIWLLYLLGRIGLVDFQLLWKWVERVELNETTAIVVGIVFIFMISLPFGLLMNFLSYLFLQNLIHLGGWLFTKIPISIDLAHFRLKWKIHILSLRDFPLFLYLLEDFVTEYDPNFKEEHYDSFTLRYFLRVFTFAALLYGGILLCWGHFSLALLHFGIGLFFLILTILNENAILLEMVHDLILITRTIPESRGEFKFLLRELGLLPELRELIEEIPSAGEKGS